MGGLTSQLPGCDVTSSPSLRCVVALWRDLAAVTTEVTKHHSAAPRCHVHSPHAKLKKGEICQRW